jgi:hypothetical protein
MEILALVIAIIALVIAIAAYHKAGGVAGLKKQTEALTNVGDTIVKATDSLRDKTADILDRMEGAIRGTEEKKETPRAARKEESDKSKEKPKAPEKTEEQK